MKLLQLQQQLSKPPMSLPHDDAYDQWAQWQCSAPVVRDTGAYHDSCGDSYDDDLQYSNLDQSSVDMDVLQFLNQRQSSTVHVSTCSPHAADNVWRSSVPAFCNQALTAAQQNTALQQQVVQALPRAAHRKYAGSEAGSVNQGTPLAHRPARAKPLGLAPSRLKVAPLAAIPTAARAKPLRLKPHATTATSAGPGSTSSATHAANSQGGTSTTDTSLPSFGLALSSGLAMRFHPNAPNPWQRPAMPSPQRWCDPTLPHQPPGPGTVPHGQQPALVAQPMHEPHAVKQQPHAGEQQQGGSQGQGGGAQLSGREGQLVQAVLQLEHLVVGGAAPAATEADRALLQRRVEALQAFLSKEKSAREEAERRLAASEQRGTALSLEVSQGLAVAMVGLGQQEVEAGRQQLVQLQQFMDTAGRHQEQFIHAANKVAAAAAARMQRLSSRLARARTALAACQAELSCCQTQRNLSEQQVAGLQAALEQLYVGKIGSEQLAQLQQQLAEQQAALLRQHQLQLQQRQQHEEEQQQLLDRQSLQQPPHPPHQPTQEGQGEGVPPPPPFHTSSLAQDELPEGQLRQSIEQQQQQQQQRQGEKWAGGSQPGSAPDPFADSDSSGSSGPGGSRQEVHSPLALRVLGAALKQLGIHTHPPTHPTARRPGPTALGTTASGAGGQSGSSTPHSPTGGAMGNVPSKHRTMAGVAAQTAAPHVPARPAPGFVAAMAAAAAGDKGGEDRHRRAKAAAAAAAAAATAAAAGSSEAAAHATLRPSMPGAAEAGGGLLKQAAQPAAMQQPSTHPVAEAGDDDDDDEEEEQEAVTGAHVKGGQAALRARRAMRADRATTLRPRSCLVSQTKTAGPPPGRPQPRPQPALSRSDSDTASSGGKPRSRGRGKEAGGGAAWQQPEVPTRLQAPDQATGGSSAALGGHPESPPATESSIRQQQPVSVVAVGEQQAVRPGSNPAASVQPGRQLADLQQLLALLQGTALPSSGSPGAVSAAVGAAKPPDGVGPGGGPAGGAPSLPAETLTSPRRDQEQRQLSSGTSQAAGLGQHPTQPAQLPPNADATAAALAPASSPAPHHVTLEGLGGTKPNPSVLSILRQHEQAVAASSAFGSTCRPGQPAAALGVQAALACWAEQPGRRRGPKELDSSPDCSDSRPAAGLEAGRAQLGRGVGQEGASGSDSEEGVGGRVRLLRGDWPVLLSGRKARPGVKGGRGGQAGHSQRSPSKAGLRSSAGLVTGPHSPASSPRHNGRGPAVWGRQSDGGHHLLAQLKLPEAPAGVHNGLAQKNTLLLGTGGTAAASSNAVLVAKEERKGGVEACLLRAGVRQEDAQLRRPSQLQRLGLLPGAWDGAGSDNTDAEPTCSAPGTALVSHSSADIVPNRATSSVMTRPLVVSTGASSAGLNAGMAASAAMFAALSESDVTDSGAGRNSLSYAIPRLPLGGARGSAVANALAHPGPTAGRANAEPAAYVSEASSPDHGPHSRLPRRPAASSSSAQTSPSGVRPGSGRVVRRGVHSPSSQWARCPAKVQPQARGSACPVKAGAVASHGTASLSPGCSSGRPSPGAAARPRSAKQPGGAQGMGSTAPLAPAESFSQPHAAPVEGSGPGSAVRRATTDGGPGVASLLVQARQLAAGFAALANTGKQRKL
ncbi:hypothetical protein QJQ45_029997 [Haematococcus lacustris]|nr:hypothetical protein QJQ45_029997 [Haematococcus lacustris]